MKIIHHASGSSGNAIQVDNVLIDAGVKTDEHYDTLLITHSHIDHIKHLKHALEHCKRFYTTDRVLTSLKDKMQRWGEKNRNAAIELIEKKFAKPDYIETFELTHDVPCVGYVIKDEYVHITDTGLFDIPESIKNKAFYTIESNYDPEELMASDRAIELIDRIKATHLSNKQSANLAKELGATEVMFVHLSSETNHPDLAKAEHELIAPEIKKHYPYEKEIILVKENEK